jgi:plastocyanin
MEMDESASSADTSPPVSDVRHNTTVIVSEQDRNGSSQCDDVSLDVGTISSVNLDNLASLGNSSSHTSCGTAADNETAVGELPSSSSAAPGEEVRFKPRKLSHRRSYRSHEEGAALEDDDLEMAPLSLPTSNTEATEAPLSSTEEGQVWYL